MPVQSGPKGIEQEMSKYKAGTLHSGSAHGPLVKSRKQAIAISLKESGMSKANMYKSQSSKSSKAFSRG